MYDNNGNIVKRREFGFTLKNNTLIEELESTDKTYTYNGDQMALYHDEACEHDAKGNPTTYNGEACIYDRMGNPTMYRGKATMWENGRRLASYDVHTFTYDGQGRRLTKDDVAFTYDSNGKLIAQSNGLEFFYDNTGVAGFTYSGAVYLYRKDVQGNIIAILNDDGEIVARYFYDAWGNHAVVDNNGAEITDTESVAHLNPFRYRSYYYDTETKLYFLKTRYYDPEIGRFMTIDGIEYLNPEVINGLNLYAYCGNNPVMNVDPNGTDWWHWLAGALAVIGTVLVVAAVTVLTCGVGTTVLAGTLAGAVIHGAAVGALIGAGVGVVAGGVIGGAVSGWTAEGILTGMGIGLGAGAIIGAIVGGVSGAASGSVGTTTRPTKEIGNYLLRDSKGSVRYTGVGDRSRMMTSLRDKSKLVSGLKAEFRPAPDRLTALVREAMYINEFGGAQSMNGTLLNLINSPGLKYIFWWL